MRCPSRARPCALCLTLWLPSACLALLSLWAAPPAGAQAPDSPANDSPAAANPEADAAFQAAERQWLDNQYEAAVTAFRAFLNAHPNDRRAPRACFRIGQAQAARGRLDEAIDAFATCHKRFPDTREGDNALYNQAHYHYEAGHWQPAAAVFFDYTKLGNSPPLRAQAWYWRAEALYKLERWADAVIAYRSFLQLDEATLQHEQVAPLVPYARLGIGVAEYGAGNYAAAVTALDGLADAYAGTEVAANALWYGGDALRRLARHDDAVVWLTRLVDQHPRGETAPEALRLLAQIETERGNAAAAQAATERLERDYPTAGALADDARLQSATERLDQGDYAAAAELYQRVVDGADAALQAAALSGLAYAQVGLQQFDAAQATLARLVAEHPDDPSAGNARSRLGDLHLRRGNDTEAEALFRDLIANRPEEAARSNARYKLALALYRQNRPAEAMALFEQVVAADPAGDLAAAVLLEMGRFAADTGDHAAARQAYQRYLEHHTAKPEAAFALYGLGQAAAAQEDWTAAADAYQRLVTEHPDHTLAEQGLFALAGAQQRLGQEAQATATLAELRRRFPGSELAGAGLLATGVAHLQAGRYAQAIEALASFVDENPTDAQLPVALANLAAAYYRATDTPDHFTRAADTYDRLARNHAGTDAARDARYWSGRAAQQAGDDARAVTAFEAFLDQQPDSRYAARARLELGRSLSRLDRHDEAVTVLQALAEDAAAPAEQTEAARVELAWALAEAGREAEAVAAFERVAAGSTDPDTVADARFWLAYHAYEVTDYDQAVSRYRAWLDDLPNHPQRPRVQLYLGWALEAAERWDEAASAFAAAERGLTAADLQQQAAFRRGYNLFRAGQQEAALDAFANFDQTYPGSRLAPEVAFYRGQSLAAAARWPEAAAVFRSLSEQHPDHLLAALALLNLGVALQNQELYADARDIYQQLMDRRDLTPDTRAGALLHLGESHFALDGYEPALEAFLRAEAAGVDDVTPAARYWAGRAYAATGQAEQARTKYQALITDYPDSDWARRAREALDQG